MELQPFPHELGLDHVSNRQLHRAGKGQDETDMYPAVELHDRERQRE